jgi:hypothetical protein
MISQWVPTMSLYNFVMENVVHIIHIRAHMLLVKHHLLLLKRNKLCIIDWWISVNLIDALIQSIWLDKCYEDCFSMFDEKSHVTICATVESVRHWALKSNRMMPNFMILKCWIKVMWESNHLSNINKTLNAFIHMKPLVSF